MKTWAERHRVGRGTWIWFACWQRRGLETRQILRDKIGVERRFQTEKGALAALAKLHPKECSLCHGTGIVRKMQIGSRIHFYNQACKCAQL